MPSDSDINGPVPTIPTHDHTPVILSPLNPEYTTAKGRNAKPPAREREPRERKESSKKREADGHPLRTPTVSIVPAKRKASSEPQAKTAAPIRAYEAPNPKASEYYPVKEVTFASHEPAPVFTPNGKVELMRPLEVAENKKDYRYDYCIADPEFKHKHFYRRTDVKPHGPAISFSDADKSMLLDHSSHHITNEKGWRMARANVCAREGTYYYEVKIIRAATTTVSSVASLVDDGPKPHIRMGWARREAPLDAPVGFDGYSYGLTDIRFQPIHRSRPAKFLQTKPPATKQKPSSKTDTAAAVGVGLDEQLNEGDVIGLEIQLPSLRLHRKVVGGIYNPAVDIDDDPSIPSWKAEPDEDPHDIIRDRIPVPFRSNMFFETMDYSPTKAMEAYTDRTLALSTLPSSTPGPTTAGATVIKQPPNPNHLEPPLRTLPHSAIRVYKNGRLVGTAFDNLLAFLPPASAPNPAAATATQGFDDGMAGYFPAVACFSGGTAQVNFGTEDRGDGVVGWWFPPCDTGSGHGIVPRPIGERYKEQIAEDVVWDLVDEVGFFMQDEGFQSVETGSGIKHEVV